MLIDNKLNIEDHNTKVLIRAFKAAYVKILNIYATAIKEDFEIHKLPDIVRFFEGEREKIERQEYNFEEAFKQNRLYETLIINELLEEIKDNFVLDNGLTVKEFKAKNKKEMDLEFDKYCANHSNALFQF